MALEFWEYFITGSDEHIVEEGGVFLVTESIEPLVTEESPREAWSNPVPSMPEVWAGFPSSGPETWVPFVS